MPTVAQPHLALLVQGKCCLIRKHKYCPLLKPMQCELAALSENSLNTFWFHSQRKFKGSTENANNNQQAANKTYAGASAASSHSRVL